MNQFLGIQLSVRIGDSFTLWGGENMHDLKDFVVEGRLENIKVFLSTKDVHLRSYLELHSGRVVHFHPVRDKRELSDASKVAQALNRLGPLRVDWDSIKLGDNAYLVNFLS